MFLYNNNIKIAIFGCGIIGIKTYYKFRKKYDVVAFIDNNLKEKDKYIYGIKVYSYKDFLEYNKNINALIIISTDKYEKEIANQLIASNKNIYYDYIPYWCLEYNHIDYIRLKNIVNNDLDALELIIKKMKKNLKGVIIYGNCQADGIRRFLINNVEFTEKYIIITIPPIWDRQNLKQVINDNLLWKECNLLITQIIREENYWGKEYSFNSIIKKLSINKKDNYTIIKIMNMKFNGYFPQDGNEVFCGYNDFDWEGIQCRDKNIIKYLRENKNGDVNEFLNIIKKEDFYSKEFINNFEKEEFNRLEMLEKQCDVHISDYILKNYKKQVLFYCPYHPKASVVKEYAIRILEYIGIKDKDFIKEDYIEQWLDKYPYNHMCEVVYPSVIKHLGLPNEFNNKLYYLNNRIFDVPMNFDEAIQCYFDICFEKKIKDIYLSIF